MNLVLKNTSLFLTKQECIPVGCVPSPAEAICWGGVCLEGGVCPGRVSAPGGEVSAQGEVSAWGVSARPPPVSRITDRCKTLPCRNYVADGNNFLFRHHTRNTKLTLIPRQTNFSKKKYPISFNNVTKIGI